MDVRDKTVVVAGAGADGSGRAISRRFASEGARVVVSDIYEAGGRETVRLIESAGGRAAFCLADVREERQVHDLIGFAERTFGSLNVLVNNASGPDIRPDEPLEHWMDNFPTDVYGTMHGTRLAIDALRRSGGGAIVNMTSITGLWHGRRNPVPGYDLAKAAVIRLTTMLAWLGEKENMLPAMPDKSWRTESGAGLLCVSSSALPVARHQLGGPGWLANLAARSEFTHVGFDVEHRSPVDGVKPLHLDGQWLHGNEAADCNANPVGPVLPPLREDAGLRPILAPSGMP